MNPLLHHRRVGAYLGFAKPLWRMEFFSFFLHLRGF